MQKRDTTIKSKKGNASDPVVIGDGAKLATVELFAAGQNLSLLLNTNCRFDLLVHSTITQFIKDLTAKVIQLKSESESQSDDLLTKSQSILSPPAKPRSASVNQSVGKSNQPPSVQVHMATQPTSITDVIDILEAMISEFSSSLTTNGLHDYDFYDVATKQTLNISTKFDSTASEWMQSRKSYKFVKIEDEKSVRLL